MNDDRSWGDGKKSNKSFSIGSFFLVTFILFSLFLLFSPCSSYAAQDSEEKTEQTALKPQKTIPMAPDESSPLMNPVAAEQRAADKAFLEKKKETTRELEEKKARLTARISQMEDENRALTRQINDLEVKNIPFSIFLNLAFLTDWGITILLWFFPIMILNHFLYLLIREKKFFSAHKVLIIVVFILVEILFFLPLVSHAEPVETFASGETEEPTFGPQIEKAESPFEKKLGEINEILKMSDVKRAIYILNNTKKGVVSLRKLDIKDPVLIPWEGSVKIGASEYYFVLASLYRHDGNESKANDALRQMVDVPVTKGEKGTSAPKYIAIYDNVLKLFLQRSEPVEAGKAVEKLTALLVSQDDIQGLKRLIGFLVTNGMQESAKKTAEGLIKIYTEKPDDNALMDLFKFLAENHMQNQAEIVADMMMKSLEAQRNSKDLIQLSRLLSKYSMEEPARLALEKTVDVCESAAEKILLAKYLLEVNKPFEANTIIDQTIDGIKSLSGQRRTDASIRMAEFLFEIGRNETASTVLESARNNTDDISQLLQIAKMARKLGFLSLAIDAISRGVQTNEKLGREYTLPPPQLIEAAKYLSGGQEDISLATYLGILQQMVKELENAEFSYKAAVAGELDAIIKSCGYDISGNINDFFYLKQFWQEFQPAKLKLLIPLYSYLQEELLQEVQNREQKEIKDLQNKVDRLQGEKADLIERRNQIRQDRNRQYLALLFQGFRAVAILLTLVLIVVGWLVKGVLHAKLMSRFKFYGFCWKFLESMGWSACFSLVGIAAGIPLIVISQFMGIIHANQQSVENLGILGEADQNK